MAFTAPGSYAKRAERFVILITEYNKDKREGVHRVAYLKGIIRVFAFECSLDIEEVHFITTRTTRLHGEHVRRAPL